MKAPLVWHLCSNRWNSAITEYALSCARALEGAGYQCIFTPLAGSPGQGRAQSYGLDTRALADFGLKRTRLLRQWWAAERPAVIMAHGGPETTLAHLAAPSLPLVRLRGYDLPENPTVPEVLRQRLGLWGVNHVITPSDTLAQKLRRCCPQKTITPVTLGCDSARFFRPTAIATTRDIVIFGRFDPIKGHAFAAKLMARALKTWPETQRRPRLHIVGEPANLTVDELKAALVDAGLKLGVDAVITAERLVDPASFLAGALLGLIPSLGSETICRVAEEFLLCGTPILVSSAGALSEALFEGAGHCFGGLDLDAAAALLQKVALEAFAENETARLERAQKARTLYSLEAMGRALNACLSPLLNR